jgi:hypothetical protein
VKSRRAWITILSLAVPALVILVLVSTWRSRSTIVVRNASATELRNIVVSGRGFKASWPILQAGESVTLSARLAADTGIAVAFDASGRHVAVPEQGYAGGGGYRITVEVSPEFSVSVQSELVA